MNKIKSTKKKNDTKFYNAIATDGKGMRHRIMNVCNSREMSKRVDLMNEHISIVNATT